MTKGRDIRKMSEAANLRSERAREAALEAIRRLQEEELPIDFQSVSNASGCSRSFLYRNADIKAAIEAARIDAAVDAATHGSADERSRSWSQNPQVEIARLRAEVHDLRKRDASITRHLEDYKNALRQLLAKFSPDQQRSTSFRPSKPESLVPAALVKNAAALLRFSNIRLSLWAIHALTDLPVADIIASIEPGDRLARELMLEIGMYKSNINRQSPE